MNNNNNQNNDPVLTWNIPYSRFHSAEDNARIRAAMEREYQETGGGEYDTDFSDSDIISYDEGESKSNFIKEKAINIVEESMNHDLAILAALDTNDEEIVLEVLLLIQEEWYIPIVDLILVEYTHARAAQMLWHRFPSLDDGSAERIRDLDSLVIDAFRNDGENKLDEVELLIEKGAVLSQKTKETLLIEALEQKHEAHIEWLITNSEPVLPFSVVSKVISFLLV